MIGFEAMDLELMMAILTGIAVILFVLANTSEESDE